MPKRSAMAPANGWPMPQSRFCSAKARAKTSRPQPFADVIGVRNSPKADRGPKPNSEIKQPHKIMTAGVRHVIARVIAEIWLMPVVLVRGATSGAHTGPIEQSDLG